MQCLRHRAQLESSEKARCFYCLMIFPASSITQWIDGGQTALCPRCTVDAVIGDNSGVDLSDEFFNRMHSYWFEK